MLDPKTGFENIGRGCSLAAGWVTIGGKRLWVDLSAAYDGRGKRRTWHIIATHYDAGGKPIRVTLSRRDCFRYEAAQDAISALSDAIATPGKSAEPLALAH